MLVKPLVRSIVRSIAGVPTNSLGSGFSPTSLFSDGSKGVVYDNNDLSSFYLDSAGTTAATVNGLVGLQLDKSANLALGAEFLTNGSFTSWTGDNPDGWSLNFTENATNYVTQVGGGVRFVCDNVTAATEIRQGTLLANTWYRLEVVVPSFTAGGVNVGFVGGTGTAVLPINAAGTYVAYIMFNSSTALAVRRIGVTDLVIGSISVKELPGNHRYQSTTGSKPVLRGTPIGSNLVTNGDFASGTGWNLGTGWTIGSGVGTKTAGTASGLDQSYAFTVGKVYRCTYTLTVTAGSFQLAFTGGTTTSGALRSASGTYVEYLTAQTGNNAIYLFGTAAFAGTVDNIEIVDVSAGSVTAPYGLQYDGVDDFLQTAAVDFTATDKMFVCAGVNQIGSGSAFIAGNSDTDAAAGTFGINAGYHLSGRFGNWLAGTLNGGRSTLFTLVVPTPYVVSTQYDLGASGASEVVCRVNATLSANQSNPDSGSGNYANKALYFGRRAGTSFPLNGLEYGLVICGKTLTSTQISQTERYIAQRTGISI